MQAIYSATVKQGAIEWKTCRLCQGFTSGSDFAHLLQFTKNVKEQCNQAVSAPCRQLQVALEPLTESCQVHRNGLPQRYLQKCIKAKR